MDPLIVQLRESAPPQGVRRTNVGHGGLFFRASCLPTDAACGRLAPNDEGHWSVVRQRNLHHGPENPRLDSQIVFAAQDVADALV